MATEAGKKKRATAARTVPATGESVTAVNFARAPTAAKMMIWPMGRCSLRGFIIVMSSAGGSSTPRTT